MKRGASTTLRRNKDATRWLENWFRVASCSFALGCWGEGADNENPMSKANREFAAYAETNPNQIMPYPSPNRHVHAIERYTDRVPTAW